MALYKKIRQDDGVTTSYHRILYIQNTINQQCSIAIASYVDDAARADEQENIFYQPYKKGITYETDYDESMTPEKAYAFLKTLPEFSDAEDI